MINSPFIPYKSLLIQHPKNKYNIFICGQILFRFPNGYGASVIRISFSYGWAEGLFELAVIKWMNDDIYELVFDTPITDDVIGYLNSNDVKDYLEKISNLRNILDVNEKNSIVKVAE